MNRDDDLKRIIDDRQLTESGRTEVIADLCRLARDGQDQAVKAMEMWISAEAEANAQVEALRARAVRAEDALIALQSAADAYLHATESGSHYASSDGTTPLSIAFEAVRKNDPGLIHSHTSHGSIARAVIRLRAALEQWSSTPSPAPARLSAERAWGFWAAEHLQGQPCSCREAFFAGFEAHNAV